MEEFILSFSKKENKTIMKERYENEGNKTREKNDAP